MVVVNRETFSMVMEVLGLVVGVTGAFIVFFGFLSRKNENRFSGRLGRLYDFLNFKTFIVEDVLRFCYVLTACLCTGIGIFMTFSIVGMKEGLLLLVVGNLVARIAFELLMLLIKACRALGIPEDQRKEPGISFWKKKTEKDKEEIPHAELNDEEMVEEVLPEKPEKEPKYRICPNCGEKCSGKFVFCNICGTKLKNEQ